MHAVAYDPVDMTTPPHPRSRRVANLATLLLISASAVLALVAGAKAIAAKDDPVSYGAFATGLSVVVIGLQAWYTRRASEAAEQALAHTRATIEVAERTSLEAAAHVWTLAPRRSSL